LVQLAGILVALAIQAAGREGTVAGSLTLNHATFTLKHVYASAEPGAFDPAAEDVRVLLSDVPLDDTTRADVFALTDLARAGHAHVVEVIIDAAGDPISGAFYAKDFGGMVSATGNVPAFVATLAPAVAATYRGTNGAARFNARADAMPADSKVVALDPQNDGSILVKIEGHEDELVVGFTVRMVRSSGTWKIGKEE
jgi:hypothetical protein